MIRGALVISLVALTALGACGKRGGNAFGNRIAFDGAYFRVKVDRDRDMPQAFTVTVRDAGKTLDGAREAARHKANEYCIRQYGNSDLTWDVSPDVDAAALPLVNGDLILSGECDGWR
ncbi:hypothetical protein [Pseudooceanicola sp. MF1-13]|uniref:hypothetical protein n=1 Tax=Pseudooceanicola sp. MF1-13 TaxID=3379095 RepID=UPI00389139AB